MKAASYPLGDRRSGRRPSISDIVPKLRPDGAPGPELPPMPPSAPLVAVHVRNEMEVLSARVRMLERENDRLKRMLGDVVIEKEVLQLAIRDGVQEAGLRVAASVRTA